MSDTREAKHHGTIPDMTREQMEVIISIAMYTPTRLHPAPTGGSGVKYRLTSGREAHFTPKLVRTDAMMVLMWQVDIQDRRDRAEVERIRDELARTITLLANTVASTGGVAA